MARVAGTVGIAAFVVMASRPITQAIATPNLSWVDTVPSEGQTTVTAHARTLENVPLTHVAPPPPGVRRPVVALGLWAPGRPERERPSSAALMATCDDLAAFLDTPPTCGPGIQRLRVATSSPPPPAGAPLELRDVDRRTAASFTTPEPVLDLPKTSSTIEADVLLPPASLERDPSALWVTDVYMPVDADERAWEEARAWIIGAEPAFRLENGLVESFESVDVTASWVLLGLLATALITTVAGFVIAVDDLGRRQEWRSLRAVGLARRG